MFIVLVMGAAVTNTGSAEGCGRSWPLCNGQFVPEFTVATAIEYSHRAVTGVEGVLVLVVAGAMLVRWRRDVEVVVLAVLMLGTLLLQAGLGAGAVLAPQSTLVLATHFGVSLVCFAATFLSAALVFERSSQRAQHTKHAQHTQQPQRAQSPPHMPVALRRWVIGVSLYLLAVVYLGAYIRHAGISLGCADWPLCNGQIVPNLDGPSGPVFAHRVAAVLAMLGLGEVLRQALKAGTGQRAAGLAVALVVVQAASGALVVWTRLGLFSTLAHAAIVALLFAALAHLLRQALRSPYRNGSVTNLYSPSDGTAQNLQPQSDDPSRKHVLATTHSGGTPASERGAVADDGRG
jgi:cytochrome c oxidase assembly protein subunit 15